MAVAKSFTTLLATISGHLNSCKKTEAPYKPATKYREKEQISRSLKRYSMMDRRNSASTTYNDIGIFHKKSPPDTEFGATQMKPPKLLPNQSGRGMASN